MNEKRRVEILDFEGRVAVKTGTFHGFVTAHDEHDVESGLRVVAIIELDDGRVELHTLSFIRFCEPEKERAHSKVGV